MIKGHRPTQTAEVKPVLVQPTEAGSPAASPGPGNTQPTDSSSQSAEAKSPTSPPSSGNTPAAGSLMCTKHQVAVRSAPDSSDVEYPLSIDRGFRVASSSDGWTYGKGSGDHPYGYVPTSYLRPSNAEACL